MAETKENTANEAVPGARPTDVEMSAEGLGFETLVEGAIEDGTGHALAPRHGTEVTTASSGSRSWSSDMELDEDDLMYPKLRIGQPTTPEVTQEIAKGGDLILAGHNPIEVVTLIPLMGSKAREYRVRDQNRRDVVKCRSLDGKLGTGDNGVNEPSPHDCTACPQAAWSGDSANRQPPQCNLIYSYVCYSMEHQQLVVVEFKKTAIGSAKFVNVNKKAHGFGNFALKMSTQKQVNDKKQTYYSPIVTLAKVDDAAYTVARQSVG